MNPILREDNNIFRILDLPEEMIQEIISSLPIKEAVRTCVLSQRWKILWKNIQKIELIEEPGEREQFKAMVERVLALHNLPTLRKLTLSFQVGEDSIQVSEWLIHFINPKMKEIVLNLGRAEQQMFFPINMFRSETLVKLELAMQSTITFPTPIIHIPNLKILSLKEVIVLNSSLSIGKFFSSLHSLEELTLIDCDWYHVMGPVIIICESLKKLVIREWGNDDDLDYVVLINGQFVPYRTTIWIFGGNQLRSFSYDGNYKNDYYFSSWFYQASARRADLDATIKVHELRNNWDAGYMVNRLLNSFVNVKRLSITSFAIQAISRTSFLPDLHVPLFENLVELNVEGSVIELTSEALLIILRNSPSLKALKFDMRVYVVDDDDIKHLLYSVPSCFQTCLKSIKICDFMAFGSEIYAIICLLLLSPVLETLCISVKPNHVFETPTAGDVQEILNRISQLPMMPPNCRLEFE